MGTSDGDDDVDLGLILGVSFGVLAFCLLAVLVAVFARRRREPKTAPSSFNSLPAEEVAAEPKKKKNMFASYEVEGSS